MNTYGYYANTLDIHPSLSTELHNKKKVWGAVFYVVLVVALVLPYVLIQNMQYSMQEKDRLVENQLKALQDRVTVLELRKKTELDSAIFQVTRVQRQLTEQQGHLSARLNALQSAFLDHEKHTHSLTESVQYAEHLLSTQQQLMAAFSEKQAQSEESLNSLHSNLAEKDAVITQLSMQVMNFTAEFGNKNLTGIFTADVLEN